jgi:hypothetical protein
VLRGFAGGSGHIPTVVGACALPQPARCSLHPVSVP